MEECSIIYPSHLLLPYVKRYWFLKIDAYNTFPNRVLPTGTISLVFHCGDRMRSLSQNIVQPNAFLSGQTTQFIDLE